MAMAKILATPLFLLLAWALTWRLGAMGRFVARAGVRERWMDSIAELERRITAALERISAGVERQMAAPVAPAPGAMAELDRLREELDEERMANAQLTERLKVQRERAERSTIELRAEVERLNAEVDAQALAMQRLVAAATLAREELRRFREAAEGEGVDAALVNSAMAIELEALHATHAADSADLAELVAALTPIVDTEEARADA